MKIEHTVFALPFAYVGAFLAVDGVPSAHDLLWITVAMVGARSLAMGLNRLIDAGIDARNPRTATPRAAGRAAVRAQVVVLLRRLAGGLPRRRLAARPDRALALADPGRGFVVYPYLKRFTWLCHLWLGAVRRPRAGRRLGCDHGQAAWQAWALGGAVALLGGGLRPLLRALRRRGRPARRAALGGRRGSE